MRTGKTNVKAYEYSCVGLMNGFDEHCFTANTEPEAIFKACEFVLKESK